MGCSHSKLEADSKPPASSRGPIRCRVASVHGRKRVVRTRKDSIVSTTDLLRSPADDISDVDVESPRLAPLVEEEEEEVKGKLGFANEDDFPGSPSFRFYFQDPDPFPDVVDVIEDDLVKPNIEVKSNGIFESQNSSEDLTRKPEVKTERVNSFKKAQNVVISLLRARARACSCHPHHNHHSSWTRVAPHMPIENDAQIQS